MLYVKLDNSLSFGIVCWFWFIWYKRLFGEGFWILIGIIIGYFNEVMKFWEVIGL